MSKKWTLFAVILGSGIVFLDSTIVPVALPKIGEELTSTFFETLEAQAYVYYGYLLALSALLILAGALSDYYGRRRLFTIGLIGFGVTSIMCGLSPNMEFLVVSRFLQGTAGAILVPGSLSIITATFQGEEQGRAFGTWAAASGATTILGPVVGGALVAYVSWRAAFLINAPLIALALWATLKHVGESRDEEATGRFHWTGAIVVAVGVGGLTFGAIRGQAQGWEGALPFVSLVLGALAIAAFPLVMARARQPLVPLGLFRSRNFTVTNLSTLLIYGSIYVTFQFLALFAIGVLGYNEVAFGITAIPASLLLTLFSTKFGALAARHGPRFYMSFGPFLMGLSLLWYVRIPSTSEGWSIDLARLGSLAPPTDFLVDVLPALVLFGAGLMVMVAPLTTALMRSVPVRNAGVASAFNNAISRVGPQLAGAVLFIIISSSFYTALADQVPRYEASSPQLREQVSPLNRPAPDAEADVAQGAREASTDAFQMAMLVAALMCFAGAAVNGIWIRNEPTAAQAEESEPATPATHAPAVEPEATP